MKIRTLAPWLLSGLLAFSSAGRAEDTDIFLNPTSTGSTNILLIIDNAGSINAQTTDIDGTSRKIYEVAGNVVKALLDPHTMQVKQSVFNASNIASGTTLTATCTNVAPTAVSGCTCASFGYDEVSSPSNGFCKLPWARADQLDTLIHSVSMGLMLFNGSNSSGANGAAQKGGYVAFHVSPMSTVPSSSNVNNFRAKLGSIPTGNGSMYAMSMYEAFRYFTNGVAENGFDGSTAFSSTSMEGYDRRACGSNTSFNPNCAAGANYTGPVTTNSCNNAIVVIGPGSPDNSALESNSTYLSGIGGSTTVITTGGTPNYDSNMFDEYARFFASYDFKPPSTDGVQPIKTYTIMNDPSPSTRSVNFMRSAGVKGGGAYFESKNAIDFINAFVTVLTKIQAVNSSFASVALPVSVNVRGTNLNQVYVGMFTPDRDGKPRWYGNMKEYQLAYTSTTNDVFLAGSDGNPAETTNGQLLADTAKSFWTSDSGPYWAFRNNVSPAPNPPVPASDNPDGPYVEKGGAAQKARLQFATATLQDTRKIYTCINCVSNPVPAAPVTLVDTVGNEATAFKNNNAAITTGNLNVSTAADRTNLIKWCRGMDLKEDENADGSYTDVRASLYGDVLHSRPAVVNYNRNTTCTTRDDNDVYIYYGANDGLLKATKGGDNSASTNGQEAWAFLPGEFLGELDKLQTNDAAVKKPYFVDGSVSSYVEYATTTCLPGQQAYRQISKAYIFPTMRRGGRFLYGLDVTTPTTPKVLWKISNSTSGFAQLGQTWSEAKVAKILVGTVTKQVLIFGGGYDTAVEDIANVNLLTSTSSGITTGPVAAPVSVSRTMGMAVYAVDVETGALVWRASNTSADCPTGAVCTVVSGMNYSIPSDLGVVDFNSNGYADRIYFGDTGANVWVASIGDSDRSNWSVYKLAQLNAQRGTETAASARRKFLYSPDVVRMGTDALVLIGSGDRESPFDKSVINRMYAIKDTGTAPASAYTDTNANWLEVSASNIGTGVALTSSSIGWFYTMTEEGEKIVSSPVTLNGHTFFNSNTPRSACGSGLGEARIYALNYATGKADVYESNGTASAYKVVDGGGYLPSGVPAVVDVGGKLREVLIVGTKVSQDLGTTQLGRRVRTYWFQNIDQ